jgi:hypothetical protein
VKKNIKYIKEVENKSATSTTIPKNRIIDGYDTRVKG